MIFRGVSRVGVVLTDDYTDDEIKQGLHVKNIVDDFRTHFKLPLLVQIFDANNVKVKDVYIYK